MTLRVGVWAAVSSEQQAAEDKVSLGEQERLGRELAATHGGQVVRVYRVAHSRDIILFEEAARLIPAYHELRADLDANRLDLLWCLDIDRLGRDPALQQAVISLVEKGAGGEVYQHTAPHVIGQKSLGHRYLESSMGVRAAEEQQLRVRRHAMGMRGRIRRGLHANHWPPGYRPVRDHAGRVVGAEFDQRIGAVRLMTERFLSGDSYQAIIEALERAGLGGWAYTTIHSALHNDCYAGYVTFGQSRNPEPSAHFPALWDRDAYAAVLRERERRAAGARGMPRGSGKLSGVCLCARCGGPMSYLRKKRRRHTDVYLRCSRHSISHRGGQGCHPNYLHESAILGELASWILDILTPGTIEQALGRGDLAGHRQELGLLEARILDLGEQRKNLALLASESSMGVEVYRAADEELLLELEAARSRAARLDHLIASAPSTAERRAALEDLALAFGARLHRAPADAVRGALLRAGIRVYCEAGKVVLIGFV